jgi:hypothetical protein
MAKVKRNGPCPCGSTKKAKRCCHGPTTYLDVRIIPLDMAEAALLVLRSTSDIELAAHFDELIYLPEVDLSLHAPLPGIITPDLDRAILALHEDDGDEFDRILDRVVPTVDTAPRRVELAHAVIALRDQGLIRPILAAIAVVDLDQDESILFTSSVAQSISVLAGDQSTPGGLFVAL